MTDLNRSWYVDLLGETKKLFKYKFKTFGNPEIFYIFSDLISTIHDDDTKA